MKKTLMAVVVLTAGWAAFTLLPAQEPAPAGAKMKVAVKGVPVAAVTGAPYSAIAVTEITQNLTDGNRIAQTQQQKVWRDSQGRERVEEASGPAAGLAASIADPVAKTGYTLDLQHHTAVQTGMVVFNGVLNGIGGRGGALNRGITIQLNTDPQQTALVAATSALQAQAAAQSAQARSLAEPVTENLAPQTMGGVFATGTRTTMTIPAGQIGNQLPIAVVDETWYSPDLQMNIMTSHSDPRSGQTAYRLTQISRTEPDPQLFQVPADYTITGGGAGGGGGRGGPAPQAAAVPSVPGVNRIGGQVMLSKLISKVDPQYTDQARNAKWQGAVTLNVVIDETGKPSDITVARSLGMGLDEQAMLAVWQWRFSPTLLNNVPVKVQTEFQVPFRLQ